MTIEELAKLITITGWTVRSTDEKIQQSFFSWASGDIEGAFLYGRALPPNGWEWVVGYKDLGTLRQRRDEARKMADRDAKHPAEVASHLFDAEVFTYVIDSVEANVDRMKVEQIYGLTGGELEDEPFVYRLAPDGEDRVHRYWYNEMPDWVEREIKSAHPTTAVSFVTLVFTELLSTVPEVLFVQNGEGETEMWEKVAFYRSGSEADCPAFDNVSEGEGKPDGGPRGCHLCMAEPGESHGKVYLGEGGEAVYRRWDEDEVEGKVRIEVKKDLRRYFVGDTEVEGSGEVMAALDLAKGRVRCIGSRWVERWDIRRVPRSTKGRWVLMVDTVEVLEG